MANQQVFQEHAARIEKAINFEPVDRVPLIFMGTAALPRLIGVTIGEWLFNPGPYLEKAVSYVTELGVDGINTPLWFRPDALLTPLWLSRLKLPRRDLAEDSLWQVDEKEVMKPEDYDVILDIGFEAFLGQYLPRVADMQLFQEAMGQFMEIVPVFGKATFDNGLVPISSGTTTIPFETLCGGRSMMAFFMDLYKKPDKIKAVLDAMVPAMIGMAVQQVEQTGIRRVWVGGWRSASALLAPKLWDKFVFPYFQQVVEALAANNIISILHLDQDWDRDIARFKELPAKKCILNSDGMTDLRKARKALGDHMAFMGDVPPALLMSGTPDEVRTYVKELIRDIGAEGLLLCPGCDAPINTKAENMKAMYDAVLDG